MPNRFKKSSSVMDLSTYSNFDKVKNSKFILLFIAHFLHCTPRRCQLASLYSLVVRKFYSNIHYWKVLSNLTYKSYSITLLTLNKQDQKRLCFFPILVGGMILNRYGHSAISACLLQLSEELLKMLYIMYSWKVHKHDMLFKLFCIRPTHVLARFCNTIFM